jgi:[ribosomal protein S5]-alanine N-acetyltransferase
MNDSNLKIQGEKVYLRYVQIEDCAEFIEINKASIEFYKGLMNPFVDSKKFKLYVENSLLESNESFMICQNVDNTIVGAINLSQIFRKAFQNCYLGYSLGVKFIGKGYMTEAVQLVLQHVFENLKLHRVEANVQPNNLASIKVLQGCGFTKEGFSRKYLKIDDVWCDHERWAIIFEDWEEK